MTISLAFTADPRWKRTGLFDPESLLALIVCIAVFVLLVRYR